jgi:hypothetical protein
MLLLAAAVFIGNQGCQPCHGGIVAAYSQTPMARSSGRVDSIPPATFAAAGHKYEVNGKRLHFDGNAISVDFFIGSNTAGRSYLHENEGYLFELPVTWYAQKQVWDASPGYERDSEIRLSRAVEPGCLGCHSSRVRPVLGTQNRYGDPPFLENGVGCERCHGPGSEHVRAPTQNRMVNPETLDPESRDAVCSQCHLSGEARIERAGHRFAEFQAGEKLSDYATYFVLSLGRRDLKVTSHTEKLSASACKRASGDKLWCGSCHEPHTNTNKTQAACLGCHSDAHHKDESCASCHMPRSVTSDANHNVLTDHSIPRIPANAAPPAGRDLVAFLGKADDRALGLAYAERGDPRAREFLLRAQPTDAPVQLRLAVLEKDASRAAALYESVLKANPYETSALVNLGAIYAGAGRTEEAAGLWERALETNPAVEAAALNLAQIRPPAAAKVILKRYLEFNPSSVSARSRLAKIP